VALVDHPCVELDIVGVDSDPYVLASLRQSVARCLQRFAILVHGEGDRLAGLGLRKWNPAT
jgi:hypothetical protein